MNTRKLLISIILGLLLFGAGYVTRGYLLVEETVQDIQVASSDSDKLPDLKQMTDPLRAEIKRLERELESAEHAPPQDQLGSSSMASLARRHNMLLEHVKKNTLYKLNFGKDFQPSDSLIECLGLEERQVQDLKRICKQAYSDMKAFELENAVAVDQTDDRLTYQIPSMPDEYQASVIESIESLFEKDDSGIISAIALRSLKKEATEKRVTFQIETKADGSESYTMKVKRKNGSNSQS